MGNWTAKEIEYIEDVADEYGVCNEDAYAIANLLGVEELYDGFLIAMEDASAFG